MADPHVCIVVMALFDLCVDMFLSSELASWWHGYLGQEDALNALKVQGTWMMARGMNTGNITHFVIKIVVRNQAKVASGKVQPWTNIHAAVNAKDYNRKESRWIRFSQHNYSS